MAMMPKMAAAADAIEVAVLCGVMDANPCAGGPRLMSTTMPQHFRACTHTHLLSHRPAKVCAALNLCAKLCNEMGLLISACILRKSYIEAHEAWEKPYMQNSKLHTHHSQIRRLKSAADTDC